jgi:Protein of unknown function (DUF1566)
MKQRLGFFAILTALLPPAVACNSILGIKQHALADAGGGSGGNGTGGLGGTSGVGGTNSGGNGGDGDGGTACGFKIPNPASTGLPNPPDYSLNTGAGTVTDRVTGLEWEGTVEPTTVYTQNQAVTHCVDKGAGWRLPSRIELVTLVDYTIAKPGPTINPMFTNSPVTNTPAAKYWTTSRGVSDTSAGWAVGFDDASTHQISGGIACKARCVRGPTFCPQTRYEVEGDVVTDTATGLRWQRTFATTQQPWANAMAICPSGWRLPSLTELQSIVDETAETPAIDKVAFPGVPMDNTSYFWTAQLQAGGSGGGGSGGTGGAGGSTAKAWYVTFIHGHADVEPVTTPYWVRCVQ